MKETIKNIKNSKSIKKANGLMAEFKKFITRGNVIDLSVGVIMGSAFGAIVTAFTNILLSLATWGVPGGLNGLVTVLPAANSSQISPLGKAYQVITTQQFVSGITIDGVTYNQSALSTLYTSIGGKYYYKGLAIINWGSIINAAISFVIIALVLFVVLKVYTSLRNLRAKRAKAKLEAYYKEHPEARPQPEVKGPTEIDLLTSINESLKILAEKEAPKKE